MPRSQEELVEKLKWIREGTEAIHAIFDRATKRSEAPEVTLDPGEIQAIFSVQMIQIGALNDIVEHLLERVGS